jgi:hypothetical protein
MDPAPNFCRPGAAVVVSGAFTLERQDWFSLSYTTSISTLIRSFQSLVIGKVCVANNEDSNLMQNLVRAAESCTAQET